MTKTIAIDFDGTLCSNEFPNIGKPHMGVIYAAIKAQYNGAKLILWTCREGELLDAAVKACEEWGLTFDAINDSTPEWKEMFGSDPRKVGATEYWDDRAVYVYEGTVQDKHPFENLVGDYEKLLNDYNKLAKAYYYAPSQSELYAMNTQWIRMCIERNKLKSENDELKEKLCKAEERIRLLATGDCEIPCDVCEYQKPCSKENCEYYEEDTVVFNGKKSPWSCFDFDWGTCKAMENTPCNGCDFEKHFKWNGK